jgi:hypothetical protein
MDALQLSLLSVALLVSTVVSIAVAAYRYGGH